MKKAVLIITTIVGVVSCNRVETDEIIEKQEPKLNDVSFSNFSKLSSSKHSNFIDNDDNRFINEENGLVITLGRKSGQCRGFGICEVKFEKIEKFSTSLNSPLSKSSSNLKHEEIILLDKKLDDTIFDTTLTIEEDIIVNNQYLVKKGEYQLNKSLGKFGGYKLNFIKL